MAFLRHIYRVSRVKKRNALHQYLLQFKMLYNKSNRRHMDTNNTNDALKVRPDYLFLLLFTTRCPGYGARRCQKKTGRDTAGSDDDYSGEDADVDFGDDDFTADRDADLGSLINDSLGAVIGGVESDTRLVNALCYEDVRLLVVRNPDSRGRDVLVIEVKLAHHKDTTDARSREFSF
jgi:hypothetical protein